MLLSGALDIALEFISDYSLKFFPRFIPEPHRVFRTVTNTQTVLFHIVALVQALCQILLPFRPERGVQ